VALGKLLNLSFLICEVENSQFPAALTSHLVIKEMVYVTHLALCLSHSERSLTVVIVILLLGYLIHKWVRKDDEFIP
jgi:hypothetical protein